MAKVYLTYRDMQIISALERCPLTVRQLRALSETFATIFGSDRRLQTRLALLAEGGILHRYRYASTEGAGQYYYTLSPDAYHLLHGGAEPLPSPGLFREIGIARQHHTKKLADFIVHTQVAAHREGILVDNFARENTLKLTVGDEHLYPDCAFGLAAPERTPFTFYVELDNSTEPLASPRERDSWLRKLRFYESLQDRSPSRFRVLGIITRSPKRMENIAALAASIAKNPLRSLFLGIYLPDYLQSPLPLTSPIFAGHNFLRVSLLPRATSTALTQIASMLTPLAQPVAV